MMSNLRLLDMPVTLLSGEEKPLRYCLGAELGQLGVAFSRIAEKVGPTNMVGECLTEAEAKVLLTPADNAARPKRVHRQYARPLALRLRQT
jgi:hypothetical protein